VNFVIFMLVVAAAGTAVYLLFFMSHVPGAAEERLGALEPLPADIGQWVRDEKPSEGGMVRERRILSGESMGMSADRLVVQVRYRHPETNKIEKVVPEEVVKRRRVRAQNS
jgi:hypothetical protein